MVSEIYGRTEWGAGQVAEGIPPVSPCPLQFPQVEAAAGPRGDAGAAGGLRGAPGRYLRQGRMGTKGHSEGVDPDQTSPR